MVIKTLNGIVYDTDLLQSDGGRGYEKDKTTGSSEVAPFYIAVMLDAIADATQQMVTTSSDSETIGTGSKTFTMDSELPFQNGAFVLIASDASPANFFFGQVTARSTFDLTVNVTKVGGSGTFSDWNIQSSGVAGPTGAGITAVVEDTTPQLGGALDGQGNNVTDIVLLKHPLIQHLLLEVGEDATKTVFRNAQFAITLTNFLGETESGTITVDLKINGTTTATLSLTTTTSNDNTFVDNTVAVGDDLTQVYSSNVSAVNASTWIVGEVTVTIPA